MMNFRNWVHYVLQSFVGSFFPKDDDVIKYTQFPTYIWDNSGEVYLWCIYFSCYMTVSNSLT